MSELSPAGIVCRNSSNVAVGSFPAMASVVGLWTFPAGIVSSSLACTTRGRAVLGRTDALIAPRKSAMLKPSPDRAISPSPSASSDRLRPSAIDREYGPVDVACLGGDEERDCRGDLGRRAGPSGRDLH